MEKRKAPRNVDSASCDVESAISSCVDRGVACDAPEYAPTIVVSENVVTASIEAARIWRMEPTASCPTLDSNPSGSNGARNRATSASNTPQML